MESSENENKQPIFKIISLSINLFFYFNTMSHSPVSKLMEPKTPSWFIDQFKNTIINLIPELVPSSFYLIGFLELTFFIFSL